MPNPPEEELRLLVSLNLEYKEPNKRFYKSLLDTYRSDALFSHVRKTKAPVLSQSAAGTRIAQETPFASVDSSSPSIILTDPSVVSPEFESVPHIRSEGRRSAPYSKAYRR